MAYKCGATACKLFNYCAGGGYNALSNVDGNSDYYAVKG